MSEDYARGAHDTYHLLLWALQHIAPEPHDDPRRPTPEALLLVGKLTSVLREVAAGGLALFDPAYLFGTRAADGARENANEVNARYRRAAQAIVDSMEWGRGAQADDPGPTDKEG